LKELSSGQEVAFGTQKVRLQEPKLHVPPYQIAVYDEVLNRNLTTVHIFRSGLYPAPPVLEWRDGRRFFFSAPVVIGSYSSSGFQYGILLQDASGRMIARTN
jgi:hypothetical protein